MQSYGMPIFCRGLQQTELRNALYRKCARGEITAAELKDALKAIQSDLDNGTLRSPQIAWPEVWTTAGRLTAKYTLATQCRTLDVLHVAQTLQLGLEEFGTTDARQTALARKTGLRVIGLPSEAP